METLKNAVFKYLPKNAKPENTFSELGFSSLQFVELLIQLEVEFDLDIIEDEDFPLGTETKVDSFIQVLNGL